jgi:pyochelin biosynthesis protein PchC
MKTSSRSASETWLRSFRTVTHATARLLVFPHAGGSASFYRGWVDDLPATVDVRVVQYPGREDRIHDPFASDLHELASGIAAALTPLVDVPVALFGHSMGAVVAYEVALRLERERTARLHLFVSGRRAPQSRLGGSVHRQDEERLIAELARLGGTATTALQNAELRALVLPSVRDDYRLIETYEPRAGELLNCSITACLGDRDPEADVDEMRAWKERTRASFELRVFPGDHFYFLPRRQELAREILGLLVPSPIESRQWPSTP